MKVSPTTTGVPAVKRRVPYVAPRITVMGDIMTVVLGPSGANHEGDFGQLPCAGAPSKC